MKIDIDDAIFVLNIEFLITKLLKIRHIDEHLLYEYFFCQSVHQATKGIKVKIQKHYFLGWYLR